LKKITDEIAVDAVIPATKNFEKDGKFFIYGNFDDTISRAIMPALIKKIDEEMLKKEGRIVIHIDSNGGETRQVIKMLNQVERAKLGGVVVETRVDAYAYSCGSMLACAGTVGERFIGEFCEHLCHLGQYPAYSIINDKELERDKARAKAHFNYIRSLYRKYAKIPNLDKAIHDDFLFIRGKKAIAWGLADKLY